MVNVWLLTGSPGTGKTTVVRQAIASSGAKAGGFYTEEIRTRGVRQGFKIITLDGQEARLAHVDTPGRYRVSKYGVDVESLESIGVSAINRAVDNSDLIVIDEIGKMELFSSRFRDAVLSAIESNKKVLGTVMLSAHPFADYVKRHPNVKIVRLTRSNHEAALKEILDWLK